MSFESFGFATVFIKFWYMRQDYTHVHDLTWWYKKRLSHNNTESLFLKLSILLSKTPLYYLFFIKPTFLPITTEQQKMCRNSPPEVFLEKGVLKICSKFAKRFYWNFGMGVLLYFCCIFSEQLFLASPLEGCFWMY